MVTLINDANLIEDKILMLLQFTARVSNSCKRNIFGGSLQGNLSNNANYGYRGITTRT